MIDVEDHEMDSAACGACWQGYPEKHEGCGGLMHAEFGDENMDGDYWLETRCSKCGEPE